MVIQANQEESDNIEAQFARVMQGPITANDSRNLKALNPPQEGRGGYADAARQFDIGHPAVVLKFPEDLPVDGVKVGLNGHLVVPGGRGENLSRFGGETSG